MELTDKSDLELIDAAIDGNQGAYSIIMERYKNSLGALIFKMVHNQEETKDLVQEAFIKAFNALESYNRKYSFSTWLFKIASNNCIDHLRKKRLKTSSIDAPIATKDGEVKQEIPDMTFNPEGKVVQDELISGIDNAIAALPEKYKDVINLRHKKDKSYEEIANQLDLPIGTIKARIFRAREMLKKSLVKMHLK